MTKWPNVPHCYGWLGLDARGHWRMVDEQAQALGLAGEKITHAGLLHFINRHYTHDERGCWYVQNGPQRVYVKLECAPNIARTDPELGWLLHTGAPLPLPIEQMWLSDTGQLWLGGAQKIALLDDRDLAECLPFFQLQGAPLMDADLTDAELMQWLEGKHGMGELTFQLSGPALSTLPALPVKRIVQANAAEIFGFVTLPQPQPTTRPPTT